jgi:hypothetical protein
MLETVLAGLAYAAPYVKNISIRVGERPRKDRDATRVTRPDAGRARCYLTSIFCTRVHDCTSPRAKRLPKLRATTLPTATLTQTSPRLRLMPPSLSTHHGSTPLCVAHWSPPSATLLNSRGGAGVSSSKCRPLGLCCGATPTGGLLDQLGGTAAPPATCG